MTTETNNSPRTRKNKMSNTGRIALILASITPIGCLCAMLIGLGITWYVYPTRYTNTEFSELSEQHTDEVVIMAAADYAKYKDVARAKEVLSQLKVANVPQYVSLVAEKLMRQHRGPVTEDIQNVIMLADALNVSTTAMIAYISSPTPLPSPTPPPTDTPMPTAIIQPTAEVVVAQVAASVNEVAEVATSVAQATEEQPTPTETPTVEPTATETDVPAAPTNTPVPVPPTDTPVPEATATVKAEFDFVVKKQRIYTKQENGGCEGMHSIFIDVIDAQGNPIKGVQIGDEWGNPGPVTGHKGDDRPGHAEWDLYKNGGFKVSVKNDPSAGRPVTSQVSDLLSSDDWKIGIPNLIAGGYCGDEGACRRDWNSGVFGEGANSLCWGHYSWELVFQRSW